jgi:hypothetical protein
MSDSKEIQTMSVDVLTQHAKSNWCAFSHGHGMLEEQVAAIDELVRRARLSEAAPPLDEGKLLHWITEVFKDGAWFGRKQKPFSEQILAPHAAKIAKRWVPEFTALLQGQLK